jgi:thiamine kinase-like enzyme
VIGEGIGFMGAVFRMVLEYPDTQLAKKTEYSVILKIPTQSGNRVFGEIAGVYEREVRFYSELQQTLNIRTPIPFLALMDDGDDPEKMLGVLKFINRLPTKVVWWLFLLARKLPRKDRDYALLLEDLSHLRAGNQVNGCSSHDAKMALAGMAKLHAQYWDSDELENIAWVVPLKLTVQLGQAVFLDCLPRYVEANKERLKPKHLELLNWLKDNAIELLSNYAKLPSTLLHGDFRLDNLFFDDTKNEIVVCDWQTLTHGPAALDLAYFLSAAMDSETKESEILDLISFYRVQLLSQGIDIDLKTLEWAYQAGMLIILHRVIPAEYQEMLELKGDRGHQIATTWIERILQKLEKVDLEEVLLR